MRRQQARGKKLMKKINAIKGFGGTIQLVRKPDNQKAMQSGDVVAPSC